MKPSPSKKKAKKKKKPSPPAAAAAAPAPPTAEGAADSEAGLQGPETLTVAAATAQAAVSETESNSSGDASTFTSAPFTASCSGTASTSSFSPFSSSASTASSSAAGYDRRDLAWLLDAFASATIDQVDSAYREAGGDPFLAAGILGSAQDTQPPQPPQPPPPPDLSPRSGSGGRKAGRRTKRVAVAATGMVADVIGKDYTRPATTPVSVPNAWKGRDGENGGSGGRKYSVEEAEQFLCSMLGDNSELGMGVVRDVLGQYGYDVEKIAKSKSSMNHPEVMIARQAIEEGRGLVVVVNKMDLLRDNQRLFEKVTDAVPREVQTVIPQVTGIPVVFVSALEGRGRIAVMRQVIDTYENWRLRLPTSLLNRWLRKVMSRHSWKDSATQPKVKYFTQVKARPPTFVAFMSGKVQLSDTDIRFLTKSLKEDFNIGGIPIRIVQRSIPRKASAKTNTRNVGPRIARMRTDKRTTVSDPTL